MAGSKATSTRFSHTPLQFPSIQIRLLWMHSADTFGISTWHRNSAPKYYAISYTWGLPAPAGEIRVEDSLFAVRPNCEYALDQVFAHVGRAYVWIDSICMDQSDNNEKSAQVAVMGSIYRRAVGVLACIGPADGASDYVCSAMEHVDVKSWLAGELWLSHESIGVVSLFHKMIDFCRRTYFKRLWVLQEACAGQDTTVFLCGPYALRKTELVLLASLLSRTMTSNIYSGELELLYQRYSLSATHKLKFPEDLANLITLECQDPRDRIYGTLSLFNWHEQGIRPPAPDYSITPVDLCLKLVKMLEPRTMPKMNILLILLGISFSSLCPQPMTSWYRPTETLEDGLPVAEDNDEAQSMQSCTWHTSIYGACRLTKDESGRLVAAGLCRLDTEASQALVTEAAAREHDPGIGTVVYTDSILSILANADVAPGDVFLQCQYFSCIIRPGMDSRTFTQVSRAVLMNGHELRKSWLCDCHDKRTLGQGVGSGYGMLQIMIEFHATDKEAMTLVVLDEKAKEREAPGFDPMNAASTLLGMDFPRLGTNVRDVTDLEGRQLLTPYRDCPVHCHRDWGLFPYPPLLFAIESGAGKDLATTLVTPPSHS